MLEDLIPVGQIPLNASWVPRGYNEPWLVEDNLEAFRASGGHPIYTEDNIRYVTNSDGYRCPEFGAQADLRVLALGCSITFGAGLAEEHIFYSRFAEQLRKETGKSVVAWNLGRSGASNDLIVRLLHLALPVLNPHVVLIQFTFINRREYVTADGRCVPITAARMKKNDDPAIDQVVSSFKNLISVKDDAVRMFHNYKSAEAALRNRLWSFSKLEHDYMPPELKAHFDPAHSAGTIQLIDRARDHKHPGPTSHKLLYQQHWEKFTALGGLDFCKDL